MVKYFDLCKNLNLYSLVLIFVITHVVGCRVADASTDNKMNVSNLATTFGPVLFNCEPVGVSLVFLLQLHYMHM